MADLILVDDDEDVREVLAEYLRMLGHEVRVAADAIGGLHLLTARLPEVALLDVEMPQVSGRDMAYRMLVEDCGRELIPIVFLSGAVDLEQIAAEVGTTYYLPKPFTLDSLSAVLEKTLRERTAPTFPLGQAGAR